MMELGISKGQFLFAQIHVHFSVISVQIGLSLPMCTVKLHNSSINLNIIWKFFIKHHLENTIIITFNQESYELIKLKLMNLMDMAV